MLKVGKFDVYSALAVGIAVESSVSVIGRVEFKPLVVFYCLMAVPSEAKVVAIKVLYIV